MRNPFVTRRPWIVFLIALILHPSIAMLYIGRGRLAGLYALAAIAVLVAFLLSYPNNFGEPASTDALALFELPLFLIGAIHASLLAWKRPLVMPMSWFSRWYVIVGLPAAYVLLLLVNREFLFPFYYLPSESMLPTFEKNDLLFVSRPTYAFGEPARGDVMSFRWHGATFIKRVIGLPGDRIEIRDSVVILNGKPLKRSTISYADGRMREYLPDGRSYEIYQLYTVGPFDNQPEMTVPSEHYYLLGDNRENSMDSRSADLGPIARQDVVGKVSVKFFDGETRRFTWRPIH
jgi:signal peptidase I